MEPKIVLLSLAVCWLTLHWSSLVSARLVPYDQGRSLSANRKAFLKVPFPVTTNVAKQEGKEDQDVTQTDDATTANNGVSLLDMLISPPTEAAFGESHSIQTRSTHLKNCKGRNEDSRRDNCQKIKIKGTRRRVRKHRHQK